MTIEAMKQALEALKAHEDIGIKSDKAIAALQKAIEEAEKQELEQVAWIEHHKGGDNLAWEAAIESLKNKHNENYTDLVSTGGMDPR